MKRIMEINQVNYGSTGNIMLGIAEMAVNQGYEVSCAYPDSRLNRRKRVDNSIQIGNIYGNKLCRELAFHTGKADCYSRAATAALIRQLKKEEVQILHLHNLHGSYLNLEMLFDFVKKEKIKVIWTLHDCWAFTGKCAHFEAVGCSFWKTGCHDCIQLAEYPCSKKDRSAFLWEQKKKWFSGVKDLTIVTPSQWLADLVKESFLGTYSVQVIHNGINLNVYHPAPGNFRDAHQLTGKFIVLGVAAPWGRRKGLDVMIELSRRLDDRFRVVLVGTDEKTDALLPKQICSIHRTMNQQELAEIYSAADVFTNPTREDNFPTVNLEALACGTPVVTFDTGGSPECIDKSCGTVVPVDDIDAMEREIIRICETRPFQHSDCISRAAKFDSRDRFQEYITLYES